MITGNIQILTADIADQAIDSRGVIFSYVPEQAILEFVYIDTKQGVVRGNHYHKEFDEYIMLVNGEGIYLEILPDGTKRKIIMAPGMTIHIPPLTPHTFVPLTDCKSVSLLTRPWNKCQEPLTPIK